MQHLVRVYQNLAGPSSTHMRLAAVVLRVLSDVVADRDAHRGRTLVVLY